MNKLERHIARVMTEYDNDSRIQAVQNAVAKIKELVREEMAILQDKLRGAEFEDCSLYCDDMEEMISEYIEKL